LTAHHGSNKLLRVRCWSYGHGCRVTIDGYTILFFSCFFTQLTTTCAPIPVWCSAMTRQSLLVPSTTLLASHCCK
jgi:hypothetical protein